MRDVKGPGRRYKHRQEGFSGWLAVTEKRIVCVTYWKRQISIGADDPKVAQLHATLPEPDTLSIAFESGAFREGWAGEIEFRFRTDRARAFAEAFHAAGAGSPVAAADNDPE
jgi:hypothetical protein